MLKRITGPNTAIAASALSSFTILGLNAITGVILARGLGTYDRGILAGILIWPMLLILVGGLGIGDALTYHVAQHPADAGRYLGSSLAIGAVQTLILSSIAVGAHVTFGAIEGANSLTIVLVFVFIIVSIAMDYSLLYLNASGLAPAFHALRVLHRLSTAMMLLLLAATVGMTVTRALLASILGYAFVVAINVYVIRGHGPLALGVAKDAIITLLRFGFASQIVTIAVAVNLFFDQWMLSLTAPPEELGRYVIATAFGAATAAVGAAIALVAIPRLARAGSREAHRKITAWLLQITIAGTILLAMVQIPLLSPVIALLLGYRDPEIVRLATMLAVGAVFMSIAYALIGVLRGLGKPHLAGLGIAVSSAVTIIGVGTVVPVYGARGAAMISIAAYLTASAVLLRITARSLEMTAGSLILFRRSAAGMASASTPAPDQRQPASWID